MISIRSGSRRYIGLVSAIAVVASLGFASGAQGQASVGLGTADSFAVLAGSEVTNTGPSEINGDLGVWPGGAPPVITGFPPGAVNGAIHDRDAVAQQAQSDLTAAYNDAAGRPCDVNLTGQDLGLVGPLTPGVYCFDTSAQLTGNLVLDAQGNPDAVFIFQIGSTLTTASNSSVTLINGAQACNVFWQVGSSATLGTGTDFVGNILALTSITANTGATVDGRLLARNGAVTLDNNIVTRARCATAGDDNGGDDQGPRIKIEGGPGDGIKGNPLGPGANGGPDGRDRKRCIARDFRLRITARDRSGIRRVKVFLDGKLIKRTTRRRFLVWIRAKRLDAGRHRIRVVAIDRVGNRTVKKRKFRRCDRPQFTDRPVSPNFTG